MTQISTGGYVRHRDRMVQESVIEDLKNALIALRWMSGTTSRRVIDPNAPSAGWQFVTTTPTQVLRVAGGHEVKVIDYFPEADSTDENAPRKTAPNTLAVDTGVPGEPAMVELGSSLMEQPYVFTMALYASSDAMALAMFNDLRDRYSGRLITDDHLDLFNYNDPDFDETTLPVVRMEIDAFRYAQDSETVTPSDVHLYFAEIQLTDIVDGSDPLAPGLPLPGGGGGSDNIVTGHGAPQPGDFEEGQEYLDLDTGDIYEWSE